MAFLVIDGIATILARLSDGGFHRRGHTERRFFSRTARSRPTSPCQQGAHTIAVGIVNIGTSLGRSILLVDNFLTDSAEVNVEIIPEPVTSALVAMAPGSRRPVHATPTRLIASQHMQHYKAVAP